MSSPSDVTFQAGPRQESATDGSPSNEDWRQLARMIQAEKDPLKMVELVQQLISRFDEENAQKNSQPGASPQ